MPNVLSHVRFFDLSEATGTRYESLLDSIDGWTKTIVGNATIVLGAGELTISGGTTAGAYADLNRFVSYGHWQPTFDKKRVIKTALEFAFKDTGSNGNFFGTGFLPLANNGFGFQIKSNGLYGYVEGALGRSEVPIHIGFIGTWLQYWLLEATLFPMSRVQFKASDGVDTYIQNLYTNLPAGDDDSGKPLSFKVSQGAALTHVLLTSSLLFFQDT